jgi:hypothetical protein
LNDQLGGTGRRCQKADVWQHLLYCYAMNHAAFLIAANDYCDKPSLEVHDWSATATLE